MADFQLTVNFVPDSRNPSRVFRSMAGLIESFGRFDRDFLAVIDLPFQSEILLHEGDLASYASEWAQKPIPTNITIAPTLRDELFQVIPIQHPTRMRLPVKKPDLIGDSQWDLYMGGRVVRAKILHREWLEKFHSRTVELRPGDMLDADFEITLLQTTAGEVVGYRYQVLKVYGVIPRDDLTQMEFLTEPTT